MRSRSQVEEKEWHGTMLYEKDGGVWSVVVWISLDLAGQHTGKEITGIYFPKPLQCNTAECIAHPQKCHSEPSINTEILNTCILPLQSTFCFSRITNNILSTQNLFMFYLPLITIFLC